MMDSVFTPGRSLGCFFLALAFSTFNCRAESADNVFFVQRIPKTPVQALVEAKVNGTSRLMFVDTGAEENVLNISYAPEFTLGESGTLHDSNNQQSSTPSAVIRQLDVGKLRIHDARVFFADQSSMIALFNHNSAGVLGLGVWKQGKLFFDYDQSVLTFHAGDWLLNGADVHEISLRKDVNIPVFESEIAGIETLFRVDTGDDGLITLTQSDFQRLVEAGVIKEKGSEKNQSINKLSSVRAGHFVKGTFMGVDLAGQEVNSTDVPYFGRLGTTWMYRFNFELDVSARKLRYQARANPLPPPVRELMIGAVLSYSPLGARVERLRPDGKGAAELVGLRSGDIIVELGGLAAPDLNVGTVGDLFQKEAGHTVSLKYKRLSDDTLQSIDFPLPPIATSWNYKSSDYMQGD